MVRRVSNPTLARALLARQFDRTVAVYRTPAKVGTKSGPLALVTGLEAVPMQILAPNTQQAAQFDLAPDGTSGGRTLRIGRCAGTWDIRTGDELRDGTQRYAVIDTDAGSEDVQRTCLLSLVSP